MNLKDERSTTSFHHHECFTPKASAMIAQVRLIFFNPLAEVIIDKLKWLHED
jgi:hypothetical protein